MAKRYEQKKKAAQIVRQQQAREERRRQLIIGGSILGVIILLGGIVAGGIWLSQRGQYDVNQPKAAHTDDGAIILGDGPVVVDVYEDFMCPACNEFEQNFGPHIDAYLDQGAITVNFHPLEFLNRFSQGTEYSSRSAAASVCAADEDLFREYKATLFSNQPAEGTKGLSDEELISLGESVGLGDSFAKCVENDTYRGWIAEGTATTSSEGEVTGTPTAFVDGSKVETSTLLDAIAAALDEAGWEAPEPEEGEEGDSGDEDATKEEDEATEEESSDGN